ncbi:MAG: SWIM zinc finger family protein [Treponema sp.]
MSFGGLFSSLSSGVYTPTKTQNNVWFKIKVCPCTCRKFIHQRTFCQHVLRVFLTLR